MHRFFVTRLADISCRFPRTVLALTLLVTVMATGFAATHFQITTDTATLISPKVTYRVNEDKFAEAFPSAGDATLVVVEGQTPELAEAGAARLAERLAQDKKHFVDVSRPDGGDFFAREGILFGKLEDVQDTTKQMISAQPFLGPLASDPSLRGIDNALNTMLMGITRNMASLDQLQTPIRSINAALTDQMNGKPTWFSWQRLFSAHNPSMQPPLKRLILARPILNLSALMPGLEASEAIHKAAADLQLDAAHGVNIRLTGAVPLSDEEFASLADKIWLVAGAMIGAMLITLWLAVRSPAIVAAIMMTTIAGLIVTAAVGLITVGRFNLISVAFIPLFVGLGVDFGIQLSVRFLAELETEPNPQKALINAANALGHSLLLAAGAVCLGFLSFLPTAYIGISELGLIAGVGILIALLFSITMMPALLMLFRPKPPRHHVGWRNLAPVDRFLVRERRWVIGSFLGLTLISIISLPWVQFDFNPLHLRNPKGEAMATLLSLMKDPNQTPNTIDIVAPDTKTAADWVSRLSKLPEVAQAVTIDSFVPQDQAPKLAVISDASIILDSTINPIETLPAPSDAEVTLSLRQTATSLREAAGTGTAEAATDARHLADSLDRLAASSPDMRQAANQLFSMPLEVMLNQMRAMLQAEAVDREGLPQNLKNDWIAKDGRIRIEVFPSGDSNDNKNLIRFAKAVQQIVPSASGMPISTQAAAYTIAKAFIQAGILAFITVCLLLFLVLRNIREVAFTLAPIILSIFLTLASCVLIRQPINFANIIAFPLLFGVGVAFHIYFVMAWRHGERNLLQSSLAHAVFFSAMATGTAFGSLWLSSHPGTASMGKILMLSLVWTLICALIFEPALLGSKENKAKEASKSTDKA
ncbi:MAG: MMPL family transporter [Zymomonas mobilis subsp. pomaceae]|uniref:MMPL family transporter n=1 Tax=Zymomonas mobilis TaxID=542 RepID=UPI0039E7EAA1